MLNHKKGKIKRIKTGNGRSINLRRGQNTELYYNDLKIVYNFIKRVTMKSLKTFVDTQSKYNTEKGIKTARRVFITHFPLTSIHLLK